MAGKNQYDIGVKITADGAQAKRSLGEVDSSMKRLGATSRAALASFTGNVGANAFSAITSYAQQAGTELLRYSAKIESTKVAFETLSGSAAFANKHLADLQKFSVANALPFESLITMSQRLQAANVDASKLVGIIRDVASVASGTGAVTAERMEGINTALTQVISKQRVSAEEMEQLAERGIPAWQMLSESMGLSVAATRKLSEEGKITSDELLTAFNKIATTKFGDSLRRQAETGTGAMIGLQNAVMVAASQAFEPIYKEISQFASKALKEVQAQNGDVEKIGEVLAKYVGEGFSRVLTATVSATVSQLYKYATARIEFLTSGGQTGALFDTATASFLGQGVKSLANELGASKDTLTAIDLAFKSTASGMQKTIADFKQSKTLEKTQQAVMAVFDSSKVMNASIAKTPSLAKQLDSKRAEAEAAKLKKTLETMTGIISDLSLQARFFGDETEVAATKQKLMSEGIFDFSSGLAKATIDWAAYIDKLKAGKEAQDQYNDGLKSAKDELASIRDAADFELRFTNASELDKFNDKVNKGAFGFKELTSEIEATRDALRQLAQQRAIADVVKGAEAFSKSISDAMSSMTGGDIGGFARTIRESIGDLKLFDGRGNLLDSNQVARDVQTIISGAVAAGTSADALGVSAGNVLEQVTKQLSAIKLLADDGTPSGQLFGVEKSGKDILALFDLYKLIQAEIQKGQLANGLTELEGVLSELGLTIAGRGFKDDLEQLNELLADPSVTLAIEKEAKAIGITAQAYKDLIRQKKAAQMAGGTRPRYVEPTKTGFDRNTLSGGLFGSNGVSRLRDEAAEITSVYQLMGNAVGDVIEGMVGASQNLLANYILTGEAGAEAFKQLAASVISSLVVQAGVKAIFELAEGFANLAKAAMGHPTAGAAAAANFKSAAMYGAVAAVAGAAAIGIGASGGLSGGSRESQEGAPDYQTAASSNVQTTGQNFNVNANLDVTKLASAVDGLNNRISSMSPGDVLTTGASQKKGFIANTAVNEMKTNPSARSGMNRVLGNV